MVQALLPFPQHRSGGAAHLGAAGNPLVRTCPISPGMVLAWWLVIARILRDKAAVGPSALQRQATRHRGTKSATWWCGPRFGVILGGRLGWVLIYGTRVVQCHPRLCPLSAKGLPMGFLTDPLRIIAAWEGGMSFHGGLLGVVIAVWLFARRTQVENAAAGATMACALSRRSVIFQRPPRQLRERRIVGPGDQRCSLGDDLSRATRCTKPAPSQPIVRSRRWKAWCFLILHADRAAPVSRP